ncbi:MAG: cytochrome class protein [Rhodospirillales bacterium]|nr:cytochrome class protein [Rhodospirillales bacterium]MDB5411551.1 cytochrome class protein [Rhodospirillales bacterium]
MRAALIVASAVFAVTGGLVFKYSGVYEAFAMSPQVPVVPATRRLAQSVAYQAQGLQLPLELETPNNLRSGARLFRDNCVVCHGAPGMPRSESAQQLQPSPPDLLRAGRRNDPAEMFLTIRNGVKTTAMPAFGEILPDEEIWTLAAFLHASRGIAALDFQALSGAGPAKTGG